MGAWPARAGGILGALAIAAILMSRNALIGAGIVIVVVIIGVAAYLMRSPAGMPPSPSPEMQPSDTMATDTNTTALPSGTSTSDASLNADLNSVDAQMSGFSSDESAANQGVSDEQNASAQ